MRPDISAILDKLEAESAERFKIVLVSTYRTPEEQWMLYKRGRQYIHDTLRNRMVWEQNGPIVTRALPWQSAHCWKLAADIALLSLDTGHYLDDNDPLWNRIGELAKGRGLEWGGDWKAPQIRDCPHIQWPDWKNFVGIDALNRQRDLFMATLRG